MPAILILILLLGKWFGVCNRAVLLALLTVKINNLLLLFLLNAF